MEGQWFRLSITSVLNRRGTERYLICYRVFVKRFDCLSKGDGYGTKLVYKYGSDLIMKRLWTEKEFIG